jgi:hypothetical protein
VVAPSGLASRHKPSVTSQTKTLLQGSATLLLAVTAVVFAITRVSQTGRVGEEGARVWFYDESEKKLYAASTATLPPDDGIGGRKGDGVRAKVAVFRDEPDLARARRIAYLETYTPELKALLAAIQEARASGRPYLGRIPSRGSAYYQTNTLVSRPDIDAWFPSHSPEAQQTLTDWQSWRGPGGQPPVVSLP